LEIVETLIKAGAPLTLMSPLLPDKHGPVSGHAIHAAVMYQKNIVLQKILTISPELIEDHVIPSLGSGVKDFTPILLAISIGGDSVEIVQTLLSHGAYFDT
jgi:hypothetical protein